MKTKYPNIFEPLTVKRTTIRNRIAMTPMGTNYGEANGEMSNRHMNYYSLRAKGGVGLIILENANVEYPVGSNVNCTPIPLCLENRGFNGMYICVLCTLLFRKRQGFYTLP